VETITIELLTDAEKEELEKIRQLIRNIEERKPMAFFIGLLAAALVLVALAIFSYYNPRLDGLLGFSMQSNQIKNLPLLLLWAIVIAAPFSLIFYFLIFKSKNHRDEESLVGLFAYGTTKELFRKLKKIKDAQKEIGARAIAGTSLLNDDLIKSHLAQRYQC